MQKTVPKGKAPTAKPPSQSAQPATTAPAEKPTGTKKSAASASQPNATAAEKAAVRARTEMETIFDKYRTLDRLDDSVDAIGPKGLTQLCQDVGIAFGDFDMYVLIWKLGATQSGCVTRSEWMHSMYQWKIEHIGHIKNNIPTWRSNVREDDLAFTEMYFHLYDFIRGDDEKLLPVDKALKAWQVLLPENERFSFLSMWAQWVALEYKRNITRDLWRQLWEFARKIKKLDQYDSNDKWPTALDDFVDWSREKIAAKEAAQRERDAARVKVA